MGDAVTLARWIGTGRRPVTPGRVLRKADVAAAGAALGVDVPTRLLPEVVNPGTVLGPQHRHRSPA